MLRKFHFLLSILLLSSIFCFTNTFANEDGGLADDIVIPEGIFDYPLIEGPERIEGIPEFHRDPEAIFGSTDFEKMRDFPTDSQEYQLGRKVSWILIFDRITDELLTACTGFLVGPDLLMTNAHCLFDDDGSLQAGRVLIFMDYYQDPEVDGTRGGVTTSAATILAADGPKDYVLLRLQDPIGETYGWLELDTTTETDTSQSVKIIQHPQLRSKEISRRNSQISDLLPDRRARRPYLLLYFADTEGGSSGSPVFLRDGTGVIAIHHSAQLNPQTRDPIVNAGSLMSHIVPEIQQYLPAAPGTPAPSYVLWIDSGTDSIQGAARDGSNVQDLVTEGLRTPSNIAVDIHSEKMYWTDSGTDTIQRANFIDGSNIEDIITTELSTPTSIAVDRFTGSITWTDSGTDRIQRANLDGSNVHDLVTEGLRTPTDIALDAYDPDLGKMYWTDSGTDKIQRANFNGSNIEDLVTEGLRTPTSIALDLVNGKMYWTDSGTNKIQRANLDGSNIEDIITIGLRTPTGIAVDPEAGKMYWTDSGTDKVQRANLDGSNIEDIVTEGLRTPTGIALSIPQMVSADPPPEPPPGPGPGPDPVATDVNGDGQVTVIDLAIVALFYGTQVPDGVDLPADVNDDGTVDLSDLTLVAQAIDAAGTSGNLSADDVAAVLEAIADIEAIPEAPAPFSKDRRGWVTRFPLRAGVAYRNVTAAFEAAKHLATDDTRLGKWMPMLTELLHLLTEMREIPNTTALLPNYPNPFNPETWIPYHLATDAAVVLTIHDVRGVLVRELTLGHQSAGIYESRARAAYWDGRNQQGEPVASGIYFYTLTAGDFTATRKLLIVK